MIWPYRIRMVEINGKTNVAESRKNNRGSCKNLPKEVILYGSRAKGTAQERSDIDIAVSGVEDFESLTEQIENLPTLFSVDIVNMDTCRNQLLLEDIRQYGRKI